MKRSSIASRRSQRHDGHRRRGRRVSGSICTGGPPVARPPRLGVLKKDLESQGVTWNDMPVAGGGGEAAMTALRARVTSGNPPSAVQALGFDITDWAKQGVVADLNEPGKSW